ncbi:RagB/SusD family nutrient uptake outer membrane protein [Segetibacter sp. 3557_3]|uniref:RagB/SusD family nutrient uptake outer membrane protein n=1 Tax=Segetibacter sp. 3557_3 TaxID=2547429 RepID=UPI0014052238|nr:RagB/SusD family nutrient uptake outer membrane protein [Segetibacter sp. 3557_3]
MIKKILYCLIAIFATNALFTGCKKDLTVVPNSLLPTDDIYTDKNLITSVLARFYQQTQGYGAFNDNWNNYQQDPDEGVNNNGAPSTGNLVWGRDRYRVMDYALIRRINQFLEGIRSDVSKKAMTPGENANFEAQALFLRAWNYFFMTRTLGGMSIVGDQVFTYSSGMDVTPLQLHRNSEAECYQYIMDQCDSAASKFAHAVTISNNNTNLGTARTLNGAIANKWAALMLKSRAAITAAAIAKYTPLRAPGNVMKDAKGTDVVGIPASQAAGFYTAALDAAKDVIENSPYTLMSNASNPEYSFYNATTLKANNTEVIWATDRKSPNVRTEYTSDVAPLSHSDGSKGNSLGATLNTVERFENRDGSDPKIKDRVGGPTSAYVFYDDVEAPFKAKDARLWGTVIWPNALYRGTPVSLKAGDLTKTTLPYTYATTPPLRSAPNASTGPNGPADVSSNFVNKTGFGVRKWLDETAGAGVLPNFSEVWFPRFRLSEAYLIAAEAALELNQAPVGLPYINKIRVDHGRIQPLSLAAFTFDKIVNENFVEFAFEDHRVWDLKRWRLAHVFWNGVQDDPNAQAFALYAFQVKVPGDPNNGKWVFDRRRAYRRVTTPFDFRAESYYASIDLGWINPNNPNWVRNPYQ